MNKSIADYLHKMGKKIKSKSERQKAQEEILNHFYDQIEDSLEHGHTWQDSVKIVLKNATDPKALGKKLNLAHRPFYLRYPLALYSLSFFLFGWIALIGVANFTAQSFLENRYISEQRDLFYQDFFKDLKDLQEEPLYGFDRTNNAHEYILSHLEVFDQYVVSEDNLAVKYCKLFDSKSKSLSCRQFDFDHKKINALREKLKKNNISYVWVDKLVDFDHWNFFEDKRIKQQMDKALDSNILAKIGNWSSIPVPNIKILNDLVYLRTYDLLEQKHDRKALELLEKYYQLVASTNTLVGGLQSSNTLKDRNKFIKLFDLKEWHNVELSRVNLIIRIHWGWTQALIDASNTNKYTAKLKPYMKPEYGVCAGVMESWTSALSSNTYFKIDYPFEPGFPIDPKKYSDLIKSLTLKCDMDAALVYLAPSKYSSDVNLGMYADFFFMGETRKTMKKILGFIPLDPAHIPYIRGIFGRSLSSIAVPNFSQIYFRDKYKRVPASASDKIPENSNTNNPNQK